MGSQTSSIRSCGKISSEQQLTRADPSAATATSVHAVPQSGIAPNRLHIRGGACRSCWRRHYSHVFYPAMFHLFVFKLMTLLAWPG